MSLVNSIVFYTSTNVYEKDFAFILDEEIIDLDELTKSTLSDFFADPNPGA